MAKKWNEVIQSDGYLSLSTERKEAARNLYFEEVVSPQVPKGKLDVARDLFDKDTQIEQQEVILDSTDMRLEPQPDSQYEPTPIQEDAPSVLNKMEREPIGAEMIGNIGEKFSERATNFVETAERQSGGTVLGTIANTPGIALAQLGQVVEGVFDVGMEVAGEVTSAVIPDSVKNIAKDSASYWANTDAGKVGIEALKGGFEKYQEFKEANPDTAMQIEGTLSILSLGAGKKVSEVVLGEATDFVQGKRIIPKSVLRKKVTKLDEDLQSTVEKGMRESLSPRGKWASKWSGQNQYFNQGTSGVTSIIENKGSLKLINDAGEEIVGELPKTLSQTAQAIEQTKAVIFKEYDELVKRYGGEPIEVDGIIRKLEAHKNKLSQSRIPNNAEKYVDNFIERLKDRGAYTAQEAQAEIQELNSLLNTFYNRKGSISEFKNANVDEIVVSALRKQLDETIEAAAKQAGDGGVEYQKLKNKYGSLVAIEEDVAKRANAMLNKSHPGLIDVGTTVLSGTQAAYAVATFNPALMLASATAKTLGVTYKKLGDPNRLIKNMFVDSEKIINKKLALEARKIKNTTRNR